MSRESAVVAATNRPTCLLSSIEAKSFVLQDTEWISNAYIDIMRRTAQGLLRVDDISCDK